MVLTEKFKKEFKLKQLLIPYSLTKGTGLCNPSVLIRQNNEILINLRHVNYVLYQNRNYYSRYGVLTYLHEESKQELRTYNYILNLDENLNLINFKKVNTSLFDKEPKWEFVGLEDARLVEWNNKLYTTGVRRDVKPDGEGRMELCEIEEEETEFLEINRVRIEPPTVSYCEKNWMPILNKPFTYVKWTIPTEVVTVDQKEKRAFTLLMRNEPEIKIEKDQRGSSQVLQVGDNYICITHEVDLTFNSKITKDGKYRHRVIIWNKDWKIEKISKPFSFLNGDIEFCTGIALYNSSFLISFGYQDNSAFLLQLPLHFINQLEYEFSR